MSETFDLTVVGDEKLHCAGCERRSDRALHRLPGVEDVGAGCETQGIALTYDPAQVSAQQLQQLHDMGYEVTDRDPAAHG